MASISFTKKRPGMAHLKRKDSWSQKSSFWFFRMWAYQSIQNRLEEERDTVWTNDQFERRQSLLQAVQGPILSTF